MPYERKRELPDQVRDSLPPEAQEIYRAAFNDAWERYADPEDRRGGSSREEAAHKTAWAAVKRKYTKEGDAWKEV